MKKMALHFLFPALLLGTLCLSAQADTVTYQITVDTSSQGGNSGYIDLQLNNSFLTSLPVTASITGFTGGILNPADGRNSSVGTTGDLASTLTIPADSSTDYFEGLMFGDSISFDVTLSGAGINVGGLAGGSSGTIFTFSFFNSDYTSAVFTSDPSGATGIIDIANDGTVSVVPLPGSPDGQSLATFTPMDNPPAVTPEPSTLSLLACAGAAFLLFRYQRTITAAR